MNEEPDNEITEQHHAHSAEQGFYDKEQITIVTWTNGYEIGTTWKGKFEWDERMQVALKEVVWCLKAPSPKSISSSYSFLA